MRFFEDLHVGDTFTSAGKTITETAMTLCVGLAGMTLPLFNDVESARATPAGGMVVPGRTTLMMMGGLEEQTLDWEPSTRLLEFRTVRFLGPVRPGDTIRIGIEIIEKRESTKGGRGIVVHRSTCQTQRGDVVLECESVHLVAARGAGGQPG